MVYIKNKEDFYYPEEKLVSLLERLEGIKGYIDQSKYPPENELRETLNHGLDYINKRNKYFIYQERVEFDIQLFHIHSKYDMHGIEEAGILLVLAVILGDIDAYKKIKNHIGLVERDHYDHQRFDCMMDKDVLGSLHTVDVLIERKLSKVFRESNQTFRNEIENKMKNSKFS